MKPTILFAIIIISSAAVGEWPAPGDLTALTGLSGRVELSWNAPPPIFEAETLAYDSGVPSPDGYIETGMDYYSVRFSPEGPCSVLSIQAYFHAAAGDRHARFFFWDLTGLGYPDIATELASPIDIYTIPSLTWGDFDASPEGVVLDGLSDFYLGVQKRDTLPEFAVFCDDTTIGETRSYKTDWFYGGHTAISGDLLMRLVVMYLDDRSIVTLTGETGKVVRPAVSFPVPDGFLERQSVPDGLRARLTASPATVISPVSYSIFRTDTWSSPLSLLLWTTVPGSVTTYTDYGVIDGLTYYYSVRADYDEGNSEMPDTVHATPYAGAPETIYDTLFFDDGVPDAGVHFPGAVIANKFNVPTRCKLIKLLYHVNTTGRGIPRVYLNDDGTPGAEILGEDTQYHLSSTGWYQINTAPYDVFVDGDFWAGIEMGSILGISLDSGSPGYAWDLPAGGSWTNIADSTYFIRAIVQYSTGSAYYHILPGWNALSLPIIPDIGLSSSDVFPFALGGQVYGWDANGQVWVEAEALKPGEGYFVLADMDTFYRLNGTPIHDYSIPWAGPGWEFIGGLSDFAGVDTTDITTTPDGLWSPKIAYYWNIAMHTWRFSTKIMPSTAYFIYLTDDGLIEARE